VTFTRKSEQLHSNLIGQHVVAGEPMTQDRLLAYTQIFGASTQGTGAPEARGAGLLLSAVRGQAYTLSILDGFLLAAVVGTVAVLLVMCLREPPVIANPAAVPPLPPEERDTVPQAVHPGS
jgi:DHA2 family multidrug resistance protein